MKKIYFLFFLLTIFSFFMHSFAAADEPKIMQSDVTHEALAQTAITTLTSELGKVVSSMTSIAANFEDDEVALCDLRLALRRSLAAFTLYEDLLPSRDAFWIRQQLTQLRIATNEVRDDDVMYQILMNEFDCSAYPFGNFKQQRSDVQQPLLELIEGLQKNDLLKNRIDQMLLEVAWPVEKGMEPAFSELAKEKLSICLAESFQSLPTYKDSFVELHHFRIRIKKIRYMMELLEELFYPERDATIYPQLVLLQSTLGRIHDLFNVEQRIQQELNRSTGNDIALFQTLILKCDALLQQEHENFFLNFTPMVFQKLQRDMMAAINEL